MKAVFGTKKGADVLRVLLAAVLVVLLIASFFALAACNKKDGPDPAAERAEAVNALKVNTLAALDAKWTPGLTDAEIIRLARPGSYIEATLWTEMLSDVVFASRLQTGKIRTAADFIASEEGKQLFADAAGNLDSALELIDALGLTTEDVSELGFDLLCAVVSEMRALYIETADRLIAIDEKGVTGDANTDLTAAIERAERIVASFGEDESAAAASVAQTLEALADAEEGVKTVLAFAYDTERILGAGESGAGLSAIIGSAAGGSGALADVSDSEMMVWLDGVLGGLKDFGASMTAEKTASVKAALKSVRECFAGSAQPVGVVSDALQWLRAAESFVDEIPTLADYAVSAFDAIYEKNSDERYTYDVVQKLRLLAEEEDEDVRTVNAYALAAKLFLSLTDSHDAEDLKGWIRSMAADGEGLKTALLYAFALMAEAYEGGGNAEVTADSTAMMSVLLTEVFGAIMEGTWRNYVLSPEKYEGRLSTIAGLVLNCAAAVNEVYAESGTQVEINITKDGPYDEAWYKEITRIREEIVKTAGSGGEALVDKAAATIGGCIDESYAARDSLRAAADVGYITDADSAEAEALRAELQRNPLFMVFAFFLVQN